MPEARSRAVLAVAVAVLASGGCGSSQSSKTAASGGQPAPASPAPTKQQFIARADALCKPVSAVVRQKYLALTKEAAKGDTQATRTAIAAMTHALSATLAAQVDKLRALQPPASDRLLVTTFLANLQSQAELTDHVATAVASNDTGAIDTADTQGKQANATVNGLAQSYGFKICGQPVKQ